MGGIKIDKLKPIKQSALIYYYFCNNFLFKNIILPDTVINVIKK